MENHPNGALISAQDFRRLIARASKGKPVKFWIVRSRKPQERFVHTGTTYNGKTGKLCEYLTDRPASPPITYNYKRELTKGHVAPLYAFENYWLAWAYYLRAVRAKEINND